MFHINYGSLCAQVSAVTDGPMQCTVCRIMLYTEVDAQYDKLAKVIRWTLTVASIVNLVPPMTFTCSLSHCAYGWSQVPGPQLDSEVCLHHDHQICHRTLSCEHWRHIYSQLPGTIETVSVILAPDINILTYLPTCLPLLNQVDNTLWGLTCCGKFSTSRVWDRFPEWSTLSFRDSQISLL